MQHHDRDRTDVDGNPEVADQGRLNLQPGRLEDIEDANAAANRASDRDVTSLRPERSSLSEGSDAGTPDREEASGAREERAQQLRPDADQGPGVAPFPPSADPMR